jgi:hypothetical protein
MSDAQAFAIDGRWRMSKVTGSDSKNTLYCSFCGKSE